MRSAIKRAIGVVVTAGLAVALTATFIGVWQDERDLQRNGTRAHVLVLSRHDERKRASIVRVRMPDGSVAAIDTYGKGEAGEIVEVVYWPDDQAGAEALAPLKREVPTGITVAVLAVPVALFGVYRLMVLPLLRGLPPATGLLRGLFGLYSLRPRDLPPPRRRTNGEGARAVKMRAVKNRAAKKRRARKRR
jgi:hypothetical protein